MKNAALTDQIQRMILCHIFFLCVLISPLNAADWRSDLKSGSFTTESHPGNDTIIKKNGDAIDNIQNGSWAKYAGFDFDTGVIYCWIEAATAGAGGTIEVRTGAVNGPIAGTIAVRSTGNISTFKPFPLKLSTPITGVKDLFLTFTGGTGNLFNLKRIHFQRFAPDYQSPNGYADWEMPVAERGLFQAISFDAKSTSISTNGDKLTSIQNASWVGYKNFDFGAAPGMNFFWVQASTSGTGGNIEVRLGSDTGELVGTITVTGTGGNYKPFWGNLLRNVSGNNDLYLKFTGSGAGTLFSLDTFRFAAGVPNGPKSMQRTLAASSFNAESAPTASPVVASGEIITNLTDNSWTRYDGIDFGSGTDLLSIEAATPNKGGTLEVRSGGIDGPLVGKINVSYTGSWTLYRPYTTMLLSPLSGVQTVFFKFIDSFGQSGNLFNVKNFTFGKKSPKAIGSSGQLSIYDPVAGLAPSPYYTFSVQKVSALNAAQKEDVTNWLSPFAWFTNCPEKGTPDTPAYYKDYIGGWSQTYCNFEMDKNTPIVIKITRKTTIGDGAPSGPIFMANAHPAHRVMSCEIINGDVYVTMSQPAQVTIDIDGQMDTRDLPRSSPSVFAYPGASKATGCHAVTIFANPFINKPSLSDPSVLAVEPGTPLPDLSGSWKTLYFKPGVHDLSMNSQTAPGKWKGTDVLKLVDGKSYYIPGDAIVFGLMNDWGDGKTNSDIRVYGHGTLNGSRVPHYYFYQGPPWNGNYSDQPMKILSIQDANNCHYEGITVADPPVFGPRIEGSPNIKQNSMKWIKIITWRTNNDGHWVSDGITEDSFIRHQDDGMYIRNHAVRRCVFWTDVNGSPCRSSFLTRDKVPETPSFRPRESVFEDTDFIYLRAVFTSANPSDPKDDPNSSIMGELGGNSAYSDGTWNTGQHTVFNNVRATDPRPFRSFFGFDATGQPTSFKGLAGLRFYNVESRFPQTFGWKEHMIGIPTGPMQNFYFDRFSFNGDKFNPDYLANPARFTSATKDMVFLDSLAGSPTSSLVVSLTKPVSFSSYTLPAAVPLAVSVSDPTAVKEVQFYIDDSLVITDSTAPYTHSATGLAAGIHQFHARIIDKNGLAYLTKVVSANVKSSGSSGTPPTIDTPASAEPSVVTGTTATLKVKGASAAGEGSLTYNWATTGTPPAGVKFSVNGTNAAKTTVVTFNKVGDYTLEVTILDGSGESVTSGPVSIKVSATLTEIVVSPKSPAIITGASITLAAQARDQFKAALLTQPTFAWSIDTGAGSLSAGVYTAPASGTGTATIRATTTSGPVMSGTAVVSFSPSTGTPPTIDTPAKANPSTVTNKTATLSVKGATTAPVGEASLTYTWATTGTPPADVTFSPNGNNAAKDTVVTFSKIGTYNLEVTIRDGSGQTVTSPVTITVNATLTKIAVSPSSSAILTSATVVLTAQALDQFGAALSAQPTFAWSIDAAGGGSVSNSGLYTAPASGTSTATIRATTTSGPVMSGTAVVSYTPSDTGTDTGGGDSGGGGGGCGLGAGFAGLLLALVFLMRARLRLVDAAG